MNLARELVAELLAIAIRFSGYEPISPSDVPEIIPIRSQYEYNLQACPPEETACQRTVALFDHKKNMIFFREDLIGDPSTSTISASFIVHELVHVLQYHEFGEKMFDTCQNLYFSELRAYNVQNAYLSSLGSSFKSGDVMKVFRCID